MHERQIVPHRPSKASEEGGKEDGGKYFLAGPAYVLQEDRLDESGQGACQPTAPPTTLGLQLLTGRWLWV
jgi:hypothetical protein